MSEAELADFAERQAAEYARQKVNAGDWPADAALRLSREHHAGLRDGAYAAAGHEFLVALDDMTGERVGWLWWGPPPDSIARKGEAFLYQITVDEPQRGRGHGAAMLVALEGRVRARGYAALFLNVFKWNAAAIALYERAGYARERDFGSSMHYRKRLA